MLYTLVTVTEPPPAVAPVAVTVTFCEPVTLVDPLITPVAALIDSPGGRPLAEKEPLPEWATVYEVMVVSFFPKILVLSGSFKLIGPTRLSKFR